jgi:hypothetical protein
MHDDVWTWGHENTCVKGWDSITNFTNLMGLVLNKQKTGSCKIAEKDSDYQVLTFLPKSLPPGEVRWGLFLKLNHKSGHFLIDQSMVDKHIEELRLQLDACKSAFDWIQVWNIYAVRFFTTHFGQSANCLGRDHVETVIKTFERIQKALFGSTSGNVTLTLKRMIEISKIDDIPDGFLYIPTSLCDLDVKNPSPHRISSATAFLLIRLPYWTHTWLKRRLPTRLPNHPSTKEPTLAISISQER